MIERYTLQAMRELWSEEKKFSTWLKVELAVLEVLESKKIVPRGTYKKIKKEAKIDVQRIHKLEVALKHDVISFTTSIAEQVGKPASYFHYGLTSSDVVDTSLSLLLVESIGLIQNKLIDLINICKKRAIEFKKLPCIGRTHGVHAEPTSFGLKFLGWHIELLRQLNQLKIAEQNIKVGKLSGAVGSYGALSPELEALVLEKLGLNIEPLATQVIPRDRHAYFFTTIALLGSTLERIATEIRHLQRTEVHEVEESFANGQKGSSAMPHKKNPISCENITGCARLLRGYALSSMENVALWHERDISHSSVERVIAPDATTLAHYMVSRLTNVIQGLKIREENIEKNLNLTQGIYFSGHVMLELVKKGLSREAAYKVVQKCAHEAWDSRENFGVLLKKQTIIKENISAKELDRILDVRNYLRYVDTIYQRQFKS